MNNNQTLQVTITGDAAPFQRAAAVATQTAAQFGDRVRGPLREIATATVGVSGGFGAIAEQALLAFGATGVVVSAVAIGVGLISTAYSKLTADTKKAREETEELIKKLNEAADLRVNPDAGGVRDLVALNAVAEARRNELELARRLLASSFGRDRFAGGTNEDVQRRVDRATLAYNEALRAINERNAQLSEEILKRSDARKDAEKRVADEAKRQADEAERQLEARRKLLAIYAPTSGLASATITTAQQFAPLAVPAGRAPSSPVTAADLAAEQAERVAEESRERLTEIMAGLSEQLSMALGDALARGITSGFEALFASGSIGQGFSALAGALLGGIGGAMKSFGEALIRLGVQMRIAVLAAKNLNPVALIGAGVALVAIGSALGAAANRAFTGGQAGGGASGFVGSSAAVGSTVDRSGSFVVNIPRDLAVQPADPRWQDVLIETIRQASGRDVEVNYT